MCWDNVTLSTNDASCLVYKDFVLFNLNPIRGPYYVEFDIDKDDHTVIRNLEVRFCNPVVQDESGRNKRSLVYLRNNATTNEQLMRAARLTSGENSYSSKNVFRTSNDDVFGIILVAE
jgi:hypothetical protein